MCSGCLTVWAVFQTHKPHLAGLRPFPNTIIVSDNADPRLGILPVSGDPRTSSLLSAQYKFAFSGRSFLFVETPLLPSKRQARTHYASSHNTSVLDIQKYLPPCKVYIILDDDTLLVDFNLLKLLNNLPNPLENVWPRCPCPFCLPSPPHPLSWSVSQGYSLPFTNTTWLGVDGREQFWRTHYCRRLHDIQPTSHGELVGGQAHFSMHG